MEMRKVHNVFRGRDIAASHAVSPVTSPGSRGALSSPRGRHLAKATFRPARCNTCSATALWVHFEPTLMVADTLFHLIIAENVIKRPQLSERRV